MWHAYDMLSIEFNNITSQDSIHLLQLRVTYHIVSVNDCYVSIIFSK